MIDPSTLQINRSRNLAGGGIALACSTSLASKQLQQTAQEKLSENYEIQLTELKKPKIKIIGMSEELSAEEIVLKMKAQNDFLKESEMNILVSGDITVQFWK